MTGVDAKLSKFNGKSNEDYSIWRIRAEIALKGKGYWKQLDKETCPENTKEKAAAIIVAALGDSAFRVCANYVDDPKQMLAQLDKRYASTRAASQISALTAVYSKRYNGKYNMAKYIDEYETLFAQLEKMGDKAKIPETHKVPLLLASLGTNSVWKTTVASLRLREIENLKWEDVTTDLIEEHKRLIQEPQSTWHKANYTGSPSNRNGSSRGRPVSKSEAKCGVCGGDYDESKCWWNPSSERCRLPEKIKQKLKGLKTESTKKNESSKIFFSNRAVVKKTDKALGAKKTKNRKYLDSGASITMFDDRKMLKQEPIFLVLKAQFNLQPVRTMQSV